MQPSIFTWDEYAAIVPMVDPTIAPEFGPEELTFLGYVPVMWDDSVVYDADEADDWREIGPFAASSYEDAVGRMRAVYGPYAAVEPLQPSMRADLYGEA